MATTNTGLIAGVCYVTVDGQSYAIKGEGTYGCSGSSRETLKGQSGIHGWKEMPQPGFMAWTGYDLGNQSVAALQDAVNATVVFQLANGKVIVGRNMWRAGEGPIEVNTEEGSLQVRFEGGDVVEQ